MEHFISVKQWDVDYVETLLNMTEQNRQENLRINKQLFATNLFFEPSTRTLMSFMIAQRKLGLEVLEFNPQSSSVQKGESLYDTAKTFESLGSDLLIIRHQADHWFDEFNSHISVPVINAGAGALEHPTQCLIDLDTIYQEFGTFKGLNVVIVGDIRHSRVARSNVEALNKLGANVYLCAAPGFEDTELDYPYVTIDEAVELSDAMMLLRIQHERHNEYINPLLNYHECYGLTLEREKQMKDHAIIMHPGPVNRNVEIASGLVEAPRSRIFKQMQNGVFVRKAIMMKLLLDWGIIDENDITKR
ncbi:MAG TPA: aspartate carbamoyltransferase catalytic subunit [Candidatus Avamphibacillus intestinigallinarum]|nr:aspartate carbamoyltransferase catalytic subunit [Candidatus Avamphibacillus intestinigallinarum]